MAVPRLRTGARLSRYATSVLGLMCLWVGACKSALPQPAASPPPIQRIAPEVVPVAYRLPEVEELPPPGTNAVAPEEIYSLTPLPLDEAVRLAMRDNPRLRQKSAEAAASRANADVAFAPFLPEINTGFRYSGFSSPVFPASAFVGASAPASVTNFMFAEAGVQYTLADFGRRAGHYNQAVNRRGSKSRPRFVLARRWPLRRPKPTCTC